MAKTRQVTCSWGLRSVPDWMIQLDRDLVDWYVFSDVLEDVVRQDFQPPIPSEIKSEIYDKFRSICELNGFTYILKSYEIIRYDTLMRFLTSMIQHIS